MFMNQDRDQLRQFYVNTLQKMDAGKPLEPLEAQVADVLAVHPEYHAALRDPDQALGRDYGPEGGETNPFLHMGLHLAIREQAATDRPAGMRQAIQAVVARMGGDAHAAEHAIMECLGRALWEAQRANQPPDEQRYLRCVQKLARGKKPR